MKIFRKLKSETKLSESNVALEMEIMVKDWGGRGNKNWNMRTETWGLILSVWIRIKTGTEKTTETEIKIRIITITITSF